jgi:hypothetical protein
MTGFKSGVIAMLWLVSLTQLCGAEDKKSCPAAGWTRGAPPQLSASLIHLLGRPFGGLFWGVFCRPFGAFGLSVLPTAHAVGCNLSPLRGWRHRGCARHRK